jgi:hypothetical protein
MATIIHKAFSQRRIQLLSQATLIVKYCFPSTIEMAKGKGTRMAAKQVESAGTTSKDGMKRTLSNL